MHKRQLSDDSPNNVGAGRVFRHNDGELDPLPTFHWNMDVKLKRNRLPNYFWHKYFFNICAFNDSNKTISFVRSIQQIDTYISF